MKKHSKEQILKRLESKLEKQKQDLEKHENSQYLKFSSVFSTSTLQAKIVTDSVIKDLTAIIALVENKENKTSPNWSINKSADMFFQRYYQSCINMRVDNSPQHMFEAESNKLFYKEMVKILMPFVSEELLKATQLLKIEF